METKNQDLKVTIITVCYNSEKTIERTIQSVLNQTYSNIEYIIIDGKSSDHTLEIIKKYSELYKNKIMFLSEPDNGIYDAMNKGIKQSIGNLIGILNSDDWYEPDAISSIVSSYYGTKYMVLYGYQRDIKDGKEYKTYIRAHEFLDSDMITHPTCFVTKATYDDFGIFDDTLKSAADYELMLRFYHSGEVKFKPVSKVITNFSIGGMSSTARGVYETVLVRYKYDLVSRWDMQKAKVRYNIFHHLKTRN